MSPSEPELPDNSGAPLIADDSSDADEGYDGTSVASSTQSLTESILSHIYENGRRYHSKSVGRYHMPSDETEQDRLDMHHHMFLELLGGELSIAPFDQDPNMVLDCGTGTGIWALDYGDYHPASTVIGIDLAPIQPSYVYPNVRFELDDLELDWTFREKFDLIHSRNMSTGIKNFPRYFKQMFDFLNPGGYVEMSEHDMNPYHCDDGTVPEDSAILRWARLTAAEMAKAGLCPHYTVDDYQRMLTDAGFEIVKTLTFKVPGGGWPKDKKMKHIGLISAEMGKSGFESYSKSLLVNGAGLSPEEADKLNQECIDIITGKGGQHAYYFQWHILARKPE
ncbi:S-adenosyl-L-methionine-dependent methyltransferase [Ascodesmis nigricans]|uniref:S-adenosyl-L-methionine-dependent methyltransferase n=1 Tax=Ascodesmis nigricans TaxID=341454 RepID=A0A4S2MLY6_9PEZI|nr:S-adenosyl-L-methionine-dependent methyltransferase [Ascodesmis nigricans]